MTDIERKDWLHTLKEGDTVYDIVYNYSTLCSVKEYTVKKITASGKIRLNDDTLCDPDGIYHKYSRWQSTTIRILPLCDEVNEAKIKLEAQSIWIECRETIERLRKEDLNLETLKQIKELLETMKS